MLFRGTMKAVSSNSKGRVRHTHPSYSVLLKQSMSIKVCWKSLKPETPRGNAVQYSSLQANVEFSKV